MRHPPDESPTAGNHPAGLPEKVMKLGGGVAVSCLPWKVPKRVAFPAVQPSGHWLLNIYFLKCELFVEILGRLEM